jgi:hypothetical protein
MASYFRKHQFFEFFRFTVILLLLSVSSQSLSSSVSSKVSSTECLCRLEQVWASFLQRGSHWVLNIYLGPRIYTGLARYCWISRGVCAPINWVKNVNPYYMGLPELRRSRSENFWIRIFSHFRVSCWKHVNSCGPRAVICPQVTPFSSTSESLLMWLLNWNNDLLWEFGKRYRTKKSKE